MAWRRLATQEAEPAAEAEELFDVELEELLDQVRSAKACPQILIGWLFHLAGARLSLRLCGQSGSVFCGGVWTDTQSGLLLGKPHRSHMQWRALMRTSS